MADVAAVVVAIGKNDQRFPRALGAIFDAPAGLFLRGVGDLGLLERPTVAIVGARACSPYGSHVARRIGQDGLIVSEYAPGVEPAPWRFPARNRIIAGLAAATVVVEARERSGALITADLALEEGREVLTVPGDITSALSEGTNRLLRQGATAATSSADVLEVFGLEPAGTEPPELGADAEQVLSRLRDGPCAVDQLARALDLDAGRLAAALAELELAGAVSEASGLYRA